MNKHCSYNPHLPQHRTNWGMPFGDEFLYNHPACLLGVFNWDKRVEMVSGRRQVVRRICFLCWIIHLTLLERIEKQRHIHGLGWNVGAWSSLIKVNRETTKCIDHIKASMGNEFKWLWILNFHVKGQAVWSTFFFEAFRMKKSIRLTQMNLTLMAGSSYPRCRGLNLEREWRKRGKTKTTTKKRRGTGWTPLVKKKHKPCNNY